MGFDEERSDEVREQRERNPHAVNNPNFCFCFAVWIISRLAGVTSLGYIHSMRPRSRLAKRDLIT